MGRYLALTGARLKGLEVLQAGIATHYVSSSLLPEVVARLAAMGPEAGSVSALDAVVREYQVSRVREYQVSTPWVGAHAWPGEVQA